MLQILTAEQTSAKVSHAMYHQRHEDFHENFDMQVFSWLLMRWCN